MFKLFLLFKKRWRWAVSHELLGIKIGGGRESEGVYEIGEKSFRAKNLLVLALANNKISTAAGSNVLWWVAVHFWNCKGLKYSRAAPSAESEANIWDCFLFLVYSAQLPRYKKKKRTTLYQHAWSIKLRGSWLLWHQSPTAKCCTTTRNSSTGERLSSEAKA